MAIIQVFDRSRFGVKGTLLLDSGCNVTHNHCILYVLLMHAGGLFHIAYVVTALSLWLVAKHH